MFVSELPRFNIAVAFKAEKPQFKLQILNIMLLFLPTNLVLALFLLTKPAHNRYM